MDDKMSGAIRDIGMRLIMQDIGAIKASVYGAKHLEDREILEELKYGIELQLSLLKSTDGFDLPDGF